MRNLIIIGMMVAAASAAGWFQINREGDSTTIQIDRAEIRSDARRAIDRGRELLDKREQQLANSQTKNQIYTANQNYTADQINPGFPAQESQFPPQGYNSQQPYANGGYQQQGYGNPTGAANQSYQQPPYHSQQNWNNKTYGRPAANGYNAPYQAQGQQTYQPVGPIQNR